MTAPRKGVFITIYYTQQNHKRLKTPTGRKAGQKAISTNVAGWARGLELGTSGLRVSTLKHTATLPSLTSSPVILTSGLASALWIIIIYRLFGSTSIDFTSLNSFRTSSGHCNTDKKSKVLLVSSLELSF